MLAERSAGAITSTATISSIESRSEIGRPVVYTPKFGPIVCRTGRRVAVHMAVLMWGKKKKNESPNPNLNLSR